MPNSLDILNARVLIVDDGDAEILALTKMLADVGYLSISTTMDPLEVCALHRENRYDLIVLDLQMPGMDGFDVMAALKDVDPTDYLSVLVITGEPIDKLRALQSGAKDLVSKPFEPLEVLTRIHNLLEVRLLYKEAEAQARYLANYDPLTGLPNRRLFYESLQRIVLQAKEHRSIVSVLLLDIDRFKNVNDTLGHSAGDELLRQCADRLRNCLRFSDMIARLGGDEFGLILLSPEHSSEVEGVATKIKEAFRSPFPLYGHEVTVTASIGITLYPNDSLDADTLVRNSDTAMYRAKDAGRDTYRFYMRQMNDRSIENFDTESALRRAVAHDEFVLHYQPKFCLRTGKILGVEALIRWRRPDHPGLVPPMEFIPILEETGLIVPVGVWVIDTVCRQIVDWQRDGVGNMCVAINLSGTQFGRENLQGQTGSAIGQNGIDMRLLEFEIETTRALRAYDLNPRLLEFELTEGVLMSHAEKSVAILQRLKSLGIGLSIDDFGTGFSSLAYLRRFPIDTIKIDRSFIRDVTTNADDASITLAIISMAHSLKLKVIAEGVETREQMDFLRAHHCDEAQGYFLSRPLPAAEISNRLRGGALALGVT